LWGKKGVGGKKGVWGRAETRKDRQHSGMYIQPGQEIKRGSSEMQKVKREIEIDR
jgi:hypothetical protein